MGRMEIPESHAADRTCLVPRIVVTWDQKPMVMQRVNVDHCVSLVFAYDINSCAVRD